MSLKERRIEWETRVAEKHVEHIVSRKHGNDVIENSRAFLPSLSHQDVWMRVTVNEFASRCAFGIGASPDGNENLKLALCRPFPRVADIQAEGMTPLPVTSWIGP